MKIQSIVITFSVFLLTSQCDGLFYDWFIPITTYDTQSWWERTYNETMNTIQNRLDQLKTNMNQLRNQLNQTNDLSLYDLFNETNINDYYSLGGCSCGNLTCSCCAHLSIEKINLNNTACLNFTYLTRDVGIEITFDVNGLVYLNKTVSESNPPEICVNVPEFKEAASLCLKFYDMIVRNASMSGCLDVIARLVNVELARVKLGCFRALPNSQYYQQSVVSVHLNGNATYYNQFNSDPLFQSSSSSFSSSSFGSTSSSWFNNWFNNYFNYKKKRNVNA